MTPSVSFIPYQTSNNSEPMIKHQKDHNILLQDTALQVVL